MSVLLFQMAHVVPQIPLYFALCFRFLCILLFVSDGSRGAADSAGADQADGRHTERRVPAAQVPSAPQDFNNPSLYPQPPN